MVFDPFAHLCGEIPNLLGAVTISARRIRLEKRASKFLDEEVPKIVGILTSVWCPNPLMGKLLHVYFVLGYRSAGLLGQEIEASGLKMTAAPKMIISRLCRRVFIRGP
jgi:hypothetical protein